MDTVHKPGVTCMMKMRVSYGASQSNVLLGAGWDITQQQYVILDNNSHIFSGSLSLKYLMGFAEDYTKGVLNKKQELIVIIAHTFNNSYIGTGEATIELSKIEWKIRHLVPEDKYKLKLYNRISKGGNNAKVKIAYDMWDLNELQP